MLGTHSEPCRGQMSHICDISAPRVKKLENIIEDMSYTCGATFEDTTMPEGLSVGFHQSP